MGEQRPGGWVEGIGWVARLGDLHRGDRIDADGDGQEGEVSGIGAPDDPLPVIVTRWADGTVPAPASPQRPQADELDVAAMRTHAESRILLGLPTMVVSPAAVLAMCAEIESDAHIAATAEPLPDGIYRSEDTYWMVRHWWDDVPPGWKRRGDADPSHEVFAVEPYDTALIAPAGGNWVYSVSRAKAATVDAIPEEHLRLPEVDFDISTPITRDQAVVIPAIIEVCRACTAHRTVVGPIGEQTYEGEWEA